MLTRIKKVVLQNPIVLAAPLVTKLDRRPTTVELIPASKSGPDRIQKAGLAALAVLAALGFLYGFFTSEWPVFFICGFMFLPLGMALWVWSLRAQMIWEVTWHEDFVYVRDGRYGKVVEWREPLSAFTGLKRDFGLLPQTGRYRAPRMVHGLLLSHPEEEKSILLYASHKEIDDDTVQYYAARLGKTLVMQRLEG